MKNENANGERTFPFGVKQRARRGYLMDGCHRHPLLFKAF